jgi:hypothetical protein
MNLHSSGLSRRLRLRMVAIASAAASVLALGTLALPGGIPAAQASVASCQQLQRVYLCTWSNSNYSGTEWNFTGGPMLGYWWYVGNSANDQISSMYDWTNSWAFVAKDCPANSNWTYIGVSVAVPNLANNEWPDGSSMNDSISAIGVGNAGEPNPNFPDHGSRPAGGC